MIFMHYLLLLARLVVNFKTNCDGKRNGTVNGIFEQQRNRLGQVLPYLFDSKLGQVDASPVDQCACVVLVISPRISLMVDQITALH